MPCNRFSLCLAAMTGMVHDMEPNTRAMKRWAGAGFATATDLADWLVRVLDMPFRDAHHVTGRLVAMAEEQKTGLEKLTLAQMQSVEPRITRRDLQGAGCRMLGEEPRQLWRHGAGQCQASGQTLADAAGEGTPGLSANRKDAAAHALKRRRIDPIFPRRMHPSSRSERDNRHHARDQNTQPVFGHAPCDHRGRGCQTKSDRRCPR